MKITRFEDIEDWQLASELTRQVYAVAIRGMFAKDFGLRDQIIRASGSAMHNIALDQSCITPEEFDAITIKPLSPTPKSADSFTI